MTDPRKAPGFKQLRHEQKVEQLLAAILDALLSQPVEPKRRKKDENA